MFVAKRALAIVARFATSYVGLVVLPLLVIVVSMNALASTQTNFSLFRLVRFGDSFSSGGLADYRQLQEARSMVVRFEGGVETLREVVTSLGAVIPAVSSRLVDEVRRDDLARASASTDSPFGLSADTARAIAAQVMGADALRSRATPTPGGPVAVSVGGAGGSALIQFGQSSATPARTPANPGGAPTATGTLAPGTTATPTATATRTATATPDTSGGGAPGATTAPAQSTAAPGGQTTPGPASTVPAVASTATAALPATTATVAAPTPLVPSPTPIAPTMTPLPAPTATPIPPTPIRPTAVPDQDAAGPTATATPVDVAMDLSVPGGSGRSFQPIFSGTFDLKAGDTATRTVHVQNNGSRTFNYFLNTSGGTGLLWTDTTNGLQMVISRNGTEVYRGPLSMSDRQIGQVARGGQDTVTITVSLPTGAGNTFQGLTTTVSYNFTAVAL